MRIGILSDIHANREGFEAALSALRRLGTDQIMLLGDIVGYGADPEYCVEAAARLMEDGAIGILGNHDAAIDGPDEDMNRIAREAIRWTRTRLLPEHRAVLKKLAISHRIEDALFVHASASQPAEWFYITDERNAERSLRATDARITIVGHVHRPHLWRLTSQGTATGHRPHQGVENPLAQSQRWLAVIGSAGQARDGRPGAGYGLLDLAQRSLTFGRVDYDHYTTARKVREAGLPDQLAERLLRGE
ncbi:MAG: metallophosphoesterase [Methylobacterium sp.]|nr:metallophosphoesterase [Methylobacterium sp.]